MKKTTTILTLAALPLALFSATKAEARPPFAAKEGVKCTYCHSGKQPERNYRGVFYGANNHSFNSFDDAAEAKKAGVEIGPLAELVPKSLTAPKPKLVVNPIYPGAGELVFGDTPGGVVKDGKPVEKGWVSLFNGKNLKGFRAEKGYWEVKDGALVGDKKGETPHHHYLFTDKDYSDFEMHVDVKMVGYNSGVCPRVQPKSFDDVPGYQVDMGAGFWGCLWDEHHRQKKILDCSQELQDALVKKEEWNHYYFRMVGPHITIYLNGVKTAEGDDPEGYPSGPIAFQLCHGPNTVASFKNLYVKPLAKPTKGTAPKSDDKPKP